jgi:hypothetical protein
LAGAVAAGSVARQIEPRGVRVDVIVAAVSAAIALAALVVSIVVAVKQAKIAVEQTAIQERLAGVEVARRAEEVEARGRARVTASVARSGRTEPIIGTGTAAIVSWQVWLVLRNDGPAPARGVELMDEGPQAPRVMGLEILPVDLQPAQQMVFAIPVGLADPPVVRVRVRWTDEAGEHEEPYTLQIH